MSHKISSGSRTGPERSAVDLSTLLGYYLACVEEEDRRSLQLSADPKYSQFVTPPGQPGALFLGEAEIDWLPGPEDLRFLDKYSSEVAKQRFLYGYPIFHEDDGYITPLFFSEVEIERAKEGRRLRIRLSHPGNIQVNLHLFRATHSMALERMDLQDHLEGPDFGTIDARIAAALAKLGAPAKDIGSVATPAGKAGWKNAAVVFRDSGAVFTAQLRRELADLKSKRQAATGTALGALLGTPAATPSQKPRLLEVTPLNRSQRAAVESAISSPLTVITGPPGTGKSQVVVAMLASFGAAGAPVLFASKNNQAVDVVRERLASILGEADWFLRLGSKANIEGELTKRIDEASKLATTHAGAGREPRDDLASLAAARDKIEETIQDRAAAFDEYLSAMDAERANLAALSAEWRDWVLSNGPKDWPTEEAKARIRTDALDVRALAGDGWPGLWLWIKRFLLGQRLLAGYREFLLSIRSQAPKGLPPWRCAGEPTWQALAADYGDLTAAQEYAAVRERKEQAWLGFASGKPVAELEADWKAASTKLVEESRELAKHLILSRLGRESARLPTLIKEYWELTQKAARLSQRAAADVQAHFARSAKGLLGIVPGVVVTSLSARRSIPMSAGLFECIIIDEASQCDIASAIPLLLRAKRLVVIGDPKQLRHISSLTEHTEQKLAAEQQATALLTKYSYRTKSLYDCAAEAVEALGESPFFLDEHYRSHPEIVEFSNRLYYQRRLVLRSPPSTTLEQAVFWHDVPARLTDGRGSLINPTEAQAVRDLVLQVASALSFQPDWTIGVVTPFRRQRDRLEQLLQAEPNLKRLGNRIRIGTVHTFQGAEADVMVFSPVIASGARPKAAEWISKEEGLLNVALTRARPAHRRRQGFLRRNAGAAG